MYVAITRAKRSCIFHSLKCVSFTGNSAITEKVGFDKFLKKMLVGLPPSRSKNYFGVSTKKSDDFFLPKNEVTSLPMSNISQEHKIFDKKKCLTMIGKSVRHNKFGDGIILNLEGTGNDSRAEVRFSDGSTKWLSLSIAKLEFM